MQLTGFAAPLYQPDDAVGPCKMYPQERRCHAKQLTCRSFVLFSRGDSMTEWAEAERKPTRRLFEQALKRGND